MEIMSPVCVHLAFPHLKKPWQPYFTPRTVVLVFAEGGGGSLRRAPPCVRGIVQKFRARDSRVTWPGSPGHLGTRGAGSQTPIQTGLSSLRGGSAPAFPGQAGDVTGVPRQRQTVADRTPNLSRRRAVAVLEVCAPRTRRPGLRAAREGDRTPLWACTEAEPVSATWRGGDGVGRSRSSRSGAEGSPCPGTGHCLREDGPGGFGAGALPRGGPTGGPGPAPALVEDPAVRVGACAVRDLGWCVHILHDQHLWGCSFLKNRLVGEHGFVGYSPELLWNNTLPDYSPGESFFTVFGVFFPAATGVMAGFNMGGDLREPEASIPLGSLAAVGISWFLYIIFTFLLGAICTREALRYDFLIAEKVSLVGFLFLLGLYISSLASCMGGLYGAPRILQCIAQEKVIPALTCLGKEKGPNKTPVAAIFLTSLVTMAFVLVGQVNILAPIVTINFMLTYVAVDYSYFSLSMVPCTIPQVTEPMLREDLEALHCSEHLLLEKAPSYGSESPAQSLSEGTLLEFTKDMDQLLQLTRKLDSGHPRPGEANRISENQKRKYKKATKQTLQDSFLLDLNSPNSFPTEESDMLPTASWEGEESYQDKWISRSEETWPEGAHGEPLVPELCRQPRVSGEDLFQKSKLQEQEIQRRPTSFYTHMCNPWVSLLGAVGSLFIMFVIQWVYTLVSMSIAAVLYFYIGQASPGLHLGSASNFSFFRWMRSHLIPSCRSLRHPQEQIIVAPSLARVDMAVTQLTQENADFATRDRYHCSSLMSREQLLPPY
ncbi:solute carrier family 12 member 8 isoform X2 [Heterocephalus glaber]|uniref:Solute carrier family 12 member 8 isoform X2 n=1 Tax=Heterocephalus glaber TaxID=10181 RepID=A0AAX6T1Q0_HETGA|nr:solute carrier family 12 member 8 isoform X2 [Heterocephalus glaber]